MRDFLKGLNRSGTMIFAAALAAFGVLEDNLGLVKPFITSHTFAWFSIGVGVAVAILRVFTTESLAHKGTDPAPGLDHPLNRANDPEPPHAPYGP